jgi:dTDP-4-dehydrorhamnose reductase
MRYLVLGVAGLVGSHVWRELRGRDAVGTYHRVPVRGATRLDLLDGSSVRQTVRAVSPTVILLCAADANVERCEIEPETTRRLNVAATREVAGAATEIGATLVVFSSEYVFAGRDQPYSEDDAPCPLNEYGRQKVLIEQIARSSGRHLVIRTSSVYGWETLGKNFVCRVLASLRAGVPVSVGADQIVRPTYASDLARSVIELLEVGATGTFHVVGSRALPRDSFAHLVADVFGVRHELIRSVPMATLGLRARRPRQAQLRDDLLRAVLGRSLDSPESALERMRDAELRHLENVAETQ